VVYWFFIQYKNKLIYVFILLNTLAVGKTNAQLREEFILAAGISQKMQAFTPRHSISGANQVS
jgi:hypothetical protein